MVIVYSLVYTPEKTGLSMYYLLNSLLSGGRSLQLYSKLKSYLQKLKENKEGREKVWVMFLKLYKKHISLLLPIKHQKDKWSKNKSSDFHKNIVKDQILI